MVKIDDKHYENVKVEASSDKVLHTKFVLNYGEVVPKLGVKVKLIGSPMSSISGIFDTGAESLCIKEDFVPKGARRVCRTTVCGATGAENADIFNLSFSLLFDGKRSVTFKNMPVIACHLPGDVNFLVGQPVIKLFDSFNVFSFKRVEIDYV